MPQHLSELFHTALSVSCPGTINIASLTLGLVCIASYLRWRGRVALYPPGPPPDPILGNVRQLLKIDNQAQAFADWERVYGWSSIIRRVVPPANMTSRSKATSTTSAYSTSRFWFSIPFQPQRISWRRGVRSIPVVRRWSWSAICKLPLTRVPSQISISWTQTRMGWGDILAHLPGGPKFRKHRKIVQDRFSPRALEKYAALQRQEAYRTLLDIGNSPDDILMHMKRRALPRGPPCTHVDVYVDSVRNASSYRLDEADSC